ncbi:MAG: flavodoxin family protein [Candidatus Bathyarchaeia archaeon]|jgi:flavorubredoxin
MRKILKIIIAIFAVLIVFFVGFAAVMFLDISAIGATQSETLTPSGSSAGRALVVYDPGLTGAAKGVADQVSSDLLSSGYTVDLAGVRSNTTEDTTGYAIVVAGGPIYGGAPTSSIKDFLNNLTPDQGTKVGVFGSGSGPQEASDIAMIKDAVTALSPEGSLPNAVVVKIGAGEDLNARAADFVAQLTS